MSKACQWSPGMNSELSSLQLGFIGHMFKILGPFRLLSNYFLNLSASSHAHKGPRVFSERLQAGEKEGAGCSVHELGFTSSSPTFENGSHKGNEDTFKESLYL